MCCAGTEPRFISPPVKTASSSSPKRGGARRFCIALKDAGLLCKETHDNVIRFAPPLVIRRKDLNWALKRIRSVFRALA